MGHFYPHQEKKAKLDSGTKSAPILLERSAQCWGRAETFEKWGINERDFA